MQEHNEHAHDHHAMAQLAAREKTYFGFWVYLLTDLLMFATLFACYVVLKNSTFGGEGAGKLFSLPYALTETMILLVSSFTSGLGAIAAHKKSLVQVYLWYGITFVLGLAFLYMEVSEFTHLFMEGNGFTRSAFLSSFFTLVGTHGLHITTGVFWMLLMFIYLIRRGLTQPAINKLTLLSVFWHFLDLVWIFIFTVVYLFGGVI